MTVSLARGRSENRSRHSIGRRDLTQWATPFGRGLAERHGRLATRIGPHPALVVSLSIGAVIATLAAIGSTRIYDSVADDNGIESLDVPVLRRAMRVRSRPLDGLAAGIARVFGPIGLPALGLAAAGAIAAKDRSRTPVVLVVAAGIGSLLMTLGGKDVIKRHRPPKRDAIPPYEHSPSFPSGHTLNTTTLAGVLAYLLALRQTRTGSQAATISAAVGTSITVGLSRVLLGAHWFTDVLVGWVSGTGWVALIITSHRLYLTSGRNHERT